MDGSQLMEKLREILPKIPFLPLTALYLGYLGYDYYTFIDDPNSALNQKKAEGEKVKVETQKLQKKVAEQKEYASKLEGKRAEIRQMAADLDAMKGTIGDVVNVPDFMRDHLMEAKKVGMTVLGLKPTDKGRTEYYGIQNFELNFRSVYMQLMVFLDRVSKSSKIVRVENITIKPVGSSLSRYVELQGTLQLRTYFYMGSNADQLAAESRQDTPLLQIKVADPKAKGGKK
ncbi:MAG: type 4a pilus biogenesis protein PilO [Bdellovibrionales bacterium]|nr:type 4a pilus biogenesis protein PilO [Bdellovibrionales bacterium]